MNERNVRNSLSSSYQRFFKRGVAGITASSRALPNFIIIGTVRSGTTSLYYNICEHPSVLPASYDEIGFFDSNFHLGINWYRSMFPTQKKMDDLKKKTKYAITGEDTPFYFWKNEVVGRILDILPNSKLIVIFRNPIDRTFSNYNLAVRTGNEKLSFKDAVKEEKEFLENHSFRESIDRPRSYLAKSIYVKQLKLWKNKFRDNQMYISCTEDMKENPILELKKIFSFLEIPEYEIKNPQKQKMYQYDKMDSGIRQELLNYFKPHNEELYSLINKKFNWDD